MAPKLSYIRDRIVEVFLFAVGMFFEPRYSLARIHATKFSMLVTALDDTCDAYATLREVISLHDAFQRYLCSLIDKHAHLPISYASMIHIYVFHVTNKEINWPGGILGPWKNYQAI